MPVSRRALESKQGSYRSARLGAALEREASQGGSSSSTPRPPVGPGVSLPYREAHAPPRPFHREAHLEAPGAAARANGAVRERSADAQRALAGREYSRAAETQIVPGIDNSDLLIELARAGAKYRADRDLSNVAEKYAISIGSHQRGRPGVKGPQDYFGGFEFPGPKLSNPHRPHNPGQSWGNGYAPDFGFGQGHGMAPWTPAAGPKGGDLGGFGSDFGGRWGVGGGSPFGTPGGRRGSDPSGHGYGHGGSHQSGAGTKTGGGGGTGTGTQTGPGSAASPKSPYGGDVVWPAGSWSSGSTEEPTQAELEEKLFEGTDPTTTYTPSGDPAKDAVADGKSIPLLHSIRVVTAVVLNAGSSVEAAKARADDPPPPPPPPPPEPKKPGSYTNPEDPNGDGPRGPWLRDGRQTSLGRGDAYGRYALPNLEGTGGPGPIGPWSRGSSRGVYLPSGREAMPNLEGTGAPGPVNPWARGTAGSYRHDAMPDPNADPGRGGPVGPRS